MKKNEEPVVGVIMGSQSDWDTMKLTTKMLKIFDVPFEVKIVSAHRTPKRLFEYGSTAVSRGLKVIVAGAGGAAHLPGMISSITRLPVLGVPIKSKALKGLDSLFSIVQMPRGVPVGTLAIGESGAENAALFAIEILSINDKVLAKKMDKYRENLTKSVKEKPVNK